MPKRPMAKKSPPFVSISTALVLLLALLLAGCAAPPPTLPTAPVKSVQIPPLPSYAKQPPTPLWCLPNCETGLTKERESWLDSLRTLTLPGLPASADTKKPTTN